jgi:hypothetical protein
VPLFLIAFFVANAFLLDVALYRWLFLGQVAFYAVALLGWGLERAGIKARLLILPFYFCLVNISPLLAMWSLLRGDIKVTWDTARPSPAPSASSPPRS